MNEVYVPGFFEVKDKLKELATEWAAVSMLARLMATGFPYPTRERDRGIRGFGWKNNSIY